MYIVIVIATQSSIAYLICNTNATTKVDVEARIYLVHGLWLFVRLREHVVVSCSHFPRCQVSKMDVLIFVNETLLWLIEWCHWPVSRWHTVWWHCILVPARIAWDPGWVPGTRYYDLMENPENCGKPWRVNPNRSLWKRGLCSCSSRNFCCHQVCEEVESRGKWGPTGLLWDYRLRRALWSTWGSHHHTLHHWLYKFLWRHHHSNQVCMLFSQQQALDHQWPEGPTEWEEEDLQVWNKDKLRRIQCEPKEGLRRCKNTYREKLETPAE